jgi:hypothetical protein
MKKPVWILIGAAVLLVLWWGSQREDFEAVVRPVATDPRLMAQITSQTGETSKIKTDAYVAALQSYYDTVYLPDKVTPSDDMVKTFVDSVTDTNINKAKLSTLINYVFLTVTPEATTATPSSANTSQTSGTTTGGSSTSSAGPNSGGTGAGIMGPTTSLKGQGAGNPYGKPVAGPEFAGLSGDSSGYDTSGKPRTYPVLFGPKGKESTYTEGVGVTPPSKSYQLTMSGVLPSASSLGSGEGAQFLPESRVPGDSDLIPDPYRTAKSYSTSTYSSKTEPVPFLSDFSAFQK